MNFQRKHQPASVNDLVFSDKRVEELIREYAAGTRTAHLLLEGPTSSGKSEAARMILHHRLSSDFGEAYTSIYQGQDFDRQTVKKLNGDWNYQITHGSAYSIIEEVDFVDDKGRRELRAHIDSKEFGTLICTTNSLSALEPAFTSRFVVVRVDPPVAQDWHNRAYQILRAEQHGVSIEQVERLMANFTGHARDFIRHMETVHLKISGPQRTTPTVGNLAIKIPNLANTKITIMPGNPPR